MYYFVALFAFFFFFSVVLWIFVLRVMYEKKRRRKKRIKSHFTSFCKRSSVCQLKDEEEKGEQNTSTYVEEFHYYDFFLQLKTFPFKQLLDRKEKYFWNLKELYFFFRVLETYCFIFAFYFIWKKSCSNMCVR